MTDSKVTAVNYRFERTSTVPLGGKYMGKERALLSLPSPFRLLIWSSLYAAFHNGCPKPLLGQSGI